MNRCHISLMHSTFVNRDGLRRRDRDGQQRQTWVWVRVRVRARRQNSGMLRQSD